MSKPLFEREEVFDEDYLYFYEAVFSEEGDEAAAEAVWRLAELAAGDEVLDLACGHGRIANRLAARGAKVTGLDATPLFLERARDDAARRGVDVDYVEGDMRSLPWRDRFDAVAIWFTSFGYFDDDDNRLVLAEACRALKPGGRLLVEANNPAFLLRHFVSAHATDRDGDLMIDLGRWDLEAGRALTERVIVRGGNVRRTSFAVRMAMPTELREWARAAGFGAVRFVDWQGDQLSLESRRMVMVATR